MLAALGAAALAVIVLLATQAGDHHRSSVEHTAPPTGITAEGAPGSVSASAGSAVPLDLTHSQLIARLGRPAGKLSRVAGGFKCLLYRMTGEPPGVDLQYCFHRGRLKFLSTYVDERLGMRTG